MSGPVRNPGKPARCISNALARCVLHCGTATLMGALLLLGGCRNGGSPPQSQTENQALTAQSETMHPSQKTDGFLVKVSVQGKEVFPNTDQQERLLAITLKLFSSCTMRSRQRVTERDWQRAWENGDCVRVHFARPRLLDSPARPQTRATDVLVPLSDAVPGAKEVWLRDDATYYSPFIGCDESLRAKLNEVITEDK